MLEPINYDKPVYSAVNIKIRKPEVNAGATNPMTVNNDNGIYNAVKIDIDKPSVNTQPKSVYDYPDAEEIVTYGMIGINPVELPEKFPINTAYEQSKFQEISPEASLKDANTNVNEENTEKNVVEPNVPEPNYTTPEAEKGVATSDEVSFHGTENNIKKPEIVPSEPIKPEVDIEKVADNLRSADYDRQALQMEEIVRAAIEDEKNATPYLVSDVFSGLIDIAQKDVTKLAPPTKAQNDARKKIINIIIAMEKNPNSAKQLEAQICDSDIALANNLSEMELATRNKEYALATMGILANHFINEVKKEDSRTIPLTDVPGASTIVDALRKDPDSSVKLAAIDALRLISRPEYKEEMTTLFTLAQSDKNPTVSKAANNALRTVNNL